ncbi:glycosyl hydrolases family 18-domain-containing protein [Aspergillus coremiiformis]|uniref:chitinase n=1 Tax=Aspergillus coremiiformis TaxID=138285 RepID=A0A5N6ZEY2_9EURO|nr:glycosyl hydrolases family 18-domain-containing protein [Aspergillus coremiiformis]
MVSFQSPKWRLWTLLVACLISQVFSISIIEPRPVSDCEDASCGEDALASHAPDDDRRPEPMKEESCSGASTLNRYIGWYDQRANHQGCDALPISDINVEPFTHLYYDGGTVDEANYAITGPTMLDDLKSIAELKQKKSSLKTFLAVGKGVEIYTMTSVPEGRRNFTDSAVKVVEENHLDGIDINWDHPGAQPGAHNTDGADYVLLLKELREAFGPKYGISVTVPSDSCVLKRYDLSGMNPYIDFFNVVSAGTSSADCRDGDESMEPPSDILAPTTNFKDVESGLDVFTQQAIDPSKITFGLHHTGRAYTMEDPQCNKPGCPGKLTRDLQVDAEPGSCTRRSGVLANHEIGRILKRSSPPEQHYDESSASMWFVYNDDQWVTFDNARTLKQKAEFANKRCLGGLMAWEFNMGEPMSLKTPNDLDPSDRSMGGARLGMMEGMDATDYSPSASSSSRPMSTGCGALDFRGRHIPLARRPDCTPSSTPTPMVDTFDASESATEPDALDLSDESMEGASVSTIESGNSTDSIPSASNSSGSPGTACGPRDIRRHLVPLARRLDCAPSSTTTPTINPTGDSEKTVTHLTPLPSKTGGTVDTDTD